MTTHFDLSDVQGNIGRGYRLPVFKQLFATIEGDVGRWKEFLSRLEPLVTRGHHQNEQPATLNVGVSYVGLARLVAPWSAALARGFPAFSAGMKARARTWAIHRTSTGARGIGVICGSPSTRRTRPRWIGR